VFCFVTSIVPLYGFYVVGEDSQFTVCWLMLAWAATVINCFVCLIRGVVLVRVRRSCALAWFAFAIFLSAALYFGFYGIGEALVELWVS